MAELWLYHRQKDAWRMVATVARHITTQLLARLLRMQALGWEVRVRATGANDQRELLMGFGGQLPAPRPEPVVTKATPVSPVVPKLAPPTPPRAKPGAKKKPTGQDDHDDGTPPL